MKKFLTFMLLLTAVFLFAACDGGGDDETVAVEGVTIAAVNTTQTVGESITLTATVTPDNATVKGVNWSSSNPEVGSIDATGKVTFASPGKVTFTATSKENANIKASTAEITVVRPELESIKVDGATKVELGGTIQLKSVATPEYADGSATWAIENESIATIDAATGVVTGVALGSTTVTATSIAKPELTATYTVTVVPEGGGEDPTSVVVTGASEVIIGYEIRNMIFNFFFIFKKSDRFQPIRINIT